MAPTNSEHASIDKEACDVPALPEVDTLATYRKVNFKKDIDSDVTLESVARSRCDDGGFDVAKYEAMEFTARWRWPDLAAQVSLHLVTLYGIYLILTFQLRFYTILFAFVTLYTSGFGITAGVHRLWSHRAYRARTPLRVLLALLFSITGQRDLYTWALDHRVHHKYAETVADPHDVRRGFWFAHVGWLVLTPHPAVEDRRRALRATSADLLDDPVVYWQKIFNIPLFAVLNVALPVLVPVYFWQETLLNSFVVSFVTRFTLTLNIAFCVNSVAHFWGNKPYDRYIKSVENKMVSVMAMGEGWHNYHHTFPWDYRTSELGRINPSTRVIDFFADLGWAYDRKTASPELIELRSQRSGDGTRHLAHSHADSIWGYGDPDQSQNERHLISQPIAS